MIFAAAALIQSKNLFKSAPKDLQAAAREHEERFPGARALGRVILTACALPFLGAFLYGGGTVSGVDAAFGDFGADF